MLSNDLQIPIFSYKIGLQYNYMLFGLKIKPKSQKTPNVLYFNQT
jgi:hypothetical protein